MASSDELKGEPAADGVDAPLVAVVVPTYEEAANLRELARRLFALHVPNSRLIVVDDGSPDGTGDVARELAVELDGRVELIQRGRKEGLGTAYLTGFARALESGVDRIVQMDADLSHEPEYIPAFLERLEQADVVVGSRYVRGGRLSDEWSAKRRLLSWTANLGIRLVAGLKVKDATSGFKGYRASALRSIDFSRLRCKGFAFQAEVAHACQRMGYRVVEHPIVFQERAGGRSKMSVGIVLEALWKLLPLRWRG